MSNIKNSLTKYIFVALSLCFVFTVAHGASLTTEEKLAKGKTLYEEGKYDDAMDNFIDVFVYGNPEQISEANEYVNMIHFKRGGVEAPKQVPYDPALESTREDGHKGKVLFDSRKNRGEEEELSEKPAKQPASSAEEDSLQAAVKEPTIYTPESEAEQANAEPVEKIVAETGMPSDDDAEVKALRRDSIDAQINTMTASLLEKIHSYQGVNVYMRGGLVDAIDIESDAIFANDGITFKPAAKEILDDVYALMVLSGTPSFVLLPPGSYSDDVSIRGVRQTVALNSYLINMGVSTAKLSFNMGLTTEQPPAKFSDLEGISIVFDYTAEPNLKLKSPEKNLPPVLSLGLYPFHSITPDKDEGMVVDFSVVQSYDKVADWALQIIQHAKDGKYYVVRQVSGSGPVYRQIFWNGKKQYFGQILPIGKYTIILRAKDTDGREKVVRRKVELLETKKETPKYAKKAAKGDLDYTIKRLWTKPEAIRQSGADKVASASEEVLTTEQPASMPEDNNNYLYQANDPYAADPYAAAGDDFGADYNTPAMDTSAAMPMDTTTMDPTAADPAAGAMGGDLAAANAAANAAAADAAIYDDPAADQGKVSVEGGAYDDASAMSEDIYY